MRIISNLPLSHEELAPEPTDRFGASSVNYDDAHAGLLMAILDAGRPDHPDLEPPPRPELEPRNRGIFLVAYLNRRPGACGGYRTLPGDPTGDTAEVARGALTESLGEPVSKLIEPGHTPASNGRRTTACS